MSALRVAWLRGERAYGDGTLQSHLLYRWTGHPGDAAAAFCGPCHVSVAGLVDLEDQRRRSPIRARRMLHFVVEHFGCELSRGVLRQRLLIAIARDTLAARTRVPIVRDGDDLYAKGRKLSVSIAAPTPVSCLIHLGVNLDPAGAPVPAIGLGSLGIRAEQEIAADVLKRYRKELDSMDRAAAKVRPVG